jgi:Zn finger protein HypA/HybF involved in hydrogenase expression
MIIIDSAGRVNYLSVCTIFYSTVIISELTAKVTGHTCRHVARHPSYLRLLAVMVVLKGTMMLTSATAPPSIQVMSWLHTCQHCSKRWISEPEHPVRCPSCKSDRWHLPRVRHVGRRTNRHFKESLKDSEYHNHNYHYHKVSEQEYADEARRDSIIDKMYLQNIGKQGLPTLNMPEPERAPLYEPELDKRPRRYRPEPEPAPEPVQDPIMAAVMAELRSRKT